MQNKAGNFIEPCIATIIPAVDGVTFPASLNISLTDGSNPDVYPITGTSYALVYEHQTSQAIAAGLVNFFAWVLSDGQNLNASVYYAPLGSALQKLAVGAAQEDHGQREAGCLAASSPSAGRGRMRPARGRRAPRGSGR